MQTDEKKCPFYEKTFTSKYCICKIKTVYVCYRFVTFWNFWQISFQQYIFLFQGPWGDICKSFAKGLEIFPRFMYNYKGRKSRREKALMLPKKMSYQPHLYLYYVIAENYAASVTALYAHICWFAKYFGKSAFLFKSLKLRQHRTMIACELRSQIFRQIA